MPIYLEDFKDSEHFDRYSSLLVKNIMNDPAYQSFIYLLTSDRFLTEILLSGFTQEYRHFEFSTLQESKILTQIISEEHQKTLFLAFALLDKADSLPYDFSLPVLFNHSSVNIFLQALSIRYGDGFVYYTSNLL